MSVLERCPSYRESNKGSKERQGPTLGVRFTEVSVLKRCPLRESRLYIVFLAFKTSVSCKSIFFFSLLQLPRIVLAIQGATER